MNQAGPDCRVTRGLSALFLLLLTVALAPQVSAERSARDGGPDSVDVLLEEAGKPRESWFEQNLLQPYRDWKSGVGNEIGLSWGSDYSAQYFIASDSPANHSAASGMFRLFGSWDMLNRGERNAGGLRFKVEYRHRFAGIPPSAYQLNLGSVGFTGASFNDDGIRLTNLYWRQEIGDRVVAYLGLLDVTDFVDVYALGSPWTAYSNLAFSTGSASMALPNDATPGFMLGGWLSDQWYATAGMSGLNSDPGDPWEGVERLFDEAEYFSYVEVGWTRGEDRFYLDNVHLTLWHVDPIAVNNTSEGWGANFSASFWVDDCYMPFVRGGYANDGGSLLELSLSAGIAWKPRTDDLLGIAANWGRPNANTFGPGLDDQFGVEVFYRAQVTDNLRVTPSLQLLFNPALNPTEDLVGVFGLRAVMTF